MKLVKPPRGFYNPYRNAPLELTMEEAIRRTRSGELRQRFGLETDSKSFYHRLVMGDPESGVKPIADYKAQIMDYEHRGLVRVKQ